MTKKDIFKLGPFRSSYKIRLFTNPLPTTVQCWPRYTRTLVYGTFAAAEAHSHHCTARWQWRGVLSAAGCGGTELLHNRENNIFLLYPLSPTLIHHSLTQHVHHGHHAALANNWGSSENSNTSPFSTIVHSLSKRIESFGLCPIHTLDYRGGRPLLLGWVAWLPYAALLPGQHEIRQNTY